MSKLSTVIKATIAIGASLALAGCAIQEQPWYPPPFGGGQIYHHVGGYGGNYGGGQIYHHVGSYGGHYGGGNGRHYGSGQTYHHVGQYGGGSRYHHVGNGSNHSGGSAYHHAGNQNHHSVHFINGTIFNPPVHSI